MITGNQIVKIRKNFNGSGQREVFRILADTNRYRIFEILAKLPVFGPKGQPAGLTVSDIAKILNISIPLSSQHLKILVLGNILEKEKQGQKVFYKLKANNKIAKSIIEKII